MNPPLSQFIRASVIVGSLAPPLAAVGDVAPMSSIPSSRSPRAAAVFVANEGQWSEDVRFGLVHGAIGAWAESTGFAVSQVGDRVAVSAIRFVDGRPSTPSGRDPAEGAFHFFLGNDPSKWRTHLPGVKALVWEEVWPGIDVVLRPSERGVEYDVVLDPDADPTLVRFEFPGNEGMRLTEDGAIEITTKHGRVRHSAPRTYLLDASGRRSPIDSSLTLSQCGELAIRFDASTRGTVVVDPGIEWATYLGGKTVAPGSVLQGEAEEFTSVQFMKDGSVVVAGTNPYADYPTTPGGIQPSIATPYTGASPADGVISRLATSGASLIFSTFLGGSSADYIHDLDLRNDGTIVMTGFTGSMNFPTTPGVFQPTYPVTGFGPIPSFVVTLSADGANLGFGTFLGGSAPVPGIEYGIAVAASPTGSIAIGGHTQSPDFPLTPGAYDTSYTTTVFEKTEGFLTVFSANGSSLEYSTFLGGARSERVVDVESDAMGYMTVVGQSNSSDFPVTPNAIGQTAIEGNQVAFTGRFDPAGNPVFLTLLNINGEGGSLAHGLAVEPSGQATLVGSSTNNFWVTPGTWLPDCFGNCRYVLRMTPFGAVVWGTFLGGFGITVNDIVVDSRGGVVLGIHGPNSLAFPLPPGAFDTTVQGDELMVLRLDADAKTVFYGSMLGGSDGDTVTWTRHPIAIDDSDSVVMIGATLSPDFPVTPGAYATTKQGPADQFVAKLDLLPTGVSKYGAATPGCSGKPTIGVTSMPKTGQLLTLTCGRASPNTFGFLLVGAAKLDPPAPLLGAALFVDTSAPHLFVPVFAAGNGNVDANFRLSPAVAPAGTRRYAQFLLRDDCAPGGIAASNALDITVQ